MATSKREIQYFQTKRSESVKYLKIFYFDSKPCKHTTKLFIKSFLENKNKVLFKFYLKFDEQQFLMILHKNCNMLTIKRFWPRTIITFIVVKPLILKRDLTLPNGNVFSVKPNFRGKFQLLTVARIHLSQFTTLCPKKCF